MFSDLFISSFRYVIRANAYDLGTPRRNSTDHTIRVNVIRNRFAPDFIGAPYTIEVDRASSVNSNIGQVVVRDRDTNRPFNDVRIEAIGDGAATGFFGLRENGAIYVKTNLANAPDREYL